MKLYRHPFFTKSSFLFFAWLIFNCCPGYAFAYNEIAAAEIFIDTDPGEGAATSLMLSSGTSPDQIAVKALQSIDVIGESPGNHILFIRFKDSSGNWSQTIQQPFKRPEILTSGLENFITKAEAFIDTDPGVGMALQLTLKNGGNPNTIVDQVLDTLDTSSAGLNKEPGNHMLYVRMKDSTGAWGEKILHPFFNPYPSSSNTLNTITGSEYRIDSGSHVPVLTPVDTIYDEVEESIDERVTVVPGYHSSRVRFFDSQGSMIENNPLPADLAYDTDQDNLPDSWELVRFGHLNYSGNDDPDGDELDNFAELLAGTDPGDNVGGDIPTISGHVLKDGSGLAGIRVCITGLGMYRCDAVTAADGSYMLNNGKPLPDHDWHVFPEMYQDYIFTPSQRVVTTSGSKVENVDFIAGNHPDPVPYYAGGGLLGDPQRNGTANPAVGFGVNSVNGNFFYSKVDAALPGNAIPFVFARYYNSQENGKNSFYTNIRQPIDFGWSHSYNIQLYVHPVEPMAEIIWGDGQRDDFTFSNGAWVPLTPGNFAELTKIDAATWQVATRNRIRYIFDGSGKLTAIKRVYETGGGDHVMQFVYNGDNELTTVTDTAGRVITFTYDGSHRIVRMDLPGPTANCAGTGKRSVQYGYTADSRLNSVTDMNCNMQRYVYSASTLSILWKNSAWDATPKLKVTFDTEGRVKKEETGWNLTTGSGEYLFDWGADSLTYQTPTGIGNAVFNRDDNKRITSIVRGGKTQSITYMTDIGPESILPSVTSDYEGHNYSSTFTNTDLTALKLPDDHIRAMSYTDHALTLMTTESGLHMNVGRNSAGRPTNIGISGAGIPAEHQPSYTLSYSSGDLLHLVESGTANGAKTEVAAYHADGQPLEIRHYVDNSTYLTILYTYDGAGRITSVKDHRGTLSCYYYDGESNLVDQVTGLTGSSCPATIPAASSVVQRTHRVYDQENRVVQVVEGYGSSAAYETSYQYNATTGVLASTCGPGGARCTQYHYDLDGKIEWIIRPGDNRKDRFYGLGSGRIRISRENVDKISSAFDRIVRYEYDGNGALQTESSCVNMSQPEDSTSDCVAYSVRKRILRDNLGRITQVQLVRDVATNDKRVINYSYSPNGLVTTVSVIGRDEKTVYTRNVAGLLISVQEKKGANSFIASYKYDGDGRLIKITDPQGLITSFTHDGLGRKLTRTDLSGTVTWSYNDSTGTVRIGKSDGTYVDVVTNRLGRITSMTTSDGDSFTYSYDSLGRLDVESWSGVGGTGSRDYDYTVYNKIDKIIGPFGKVVDYTYDVTNRRTRIAFDARQIDYIYNGLDEIKKMYTPAGTFDFAMDDYTGALQQITYPEASGLLATYERNDLGELIRLTVKKGTNVITDYQITLDGLGRRQNIVSEQPMAPSFSNETLNVLQQTSGVNKGLIDTINGAAVDYDSRGNITSLPAPYASDFTYDVLDRLTAAGTTLHKYDAARNRLETVRSGEPTRYLLDMSGSSPDVLATMDDQNAIQNIYIHTPGGLVAEVKNDGTTRFVIQDFNSNVVALTDQNGTVSSFYAYTPFGNNGGMLGDGAFPFRFAGGVGAVTDPEGVVYMRARYYHSGIQQFTSADLVPGDLARPQSLGRYSYVEGMGLGGVDPTGLRLWDLGLSDFFSARLQVQKAEQRAASARLKLRLANSLESKYGTLAGGLKQSAKLDFIHERHMWDMSVIGFEKSIDQASFIKEQSGNAASAVSLVIGDPKAAATAAKIMFASKCGKNGIEFAGGEKGITQAFVECGLAGVSLKVDKAIGEKFSGGTVVDFIDKNIIQGLESAASTTFLVVAKHIDGEEPQFLGDDFLNSLDPRWWAAEIMADSIK